MANYYVNSQPNWRDMQAPTTDRWKAFAGPAALWPAVRSKIINQNGQLLVLLVTELY